MAGVRAKDHDDKRQMILDKAASLFGQQGFHKTSIAELSAACNASKAWIFHYFPNKEAILFTLLRDFIEMFRDRTAAAIARGNGPRGRLRAYILECLLIFEQYRINYPILFNDMKLLPAVDQKTLKGVERENARMLGELVTDINPNIAASKVIVAPVTFVVFGAINWTYTWYDPDGPLSLDRVVELIEKLLVEGLQGL